MRYVAILLAVLSSAVTVAADAAKPVTSIEPVQDIPPRFEFITLRRNTTGSWSSGFFPSAPNRRAEFNMGLGGLILRAYAQTPLPGPLANAPSWLSEERYDMVIGGPFLTLSRAEAQPLWRELLARRLELMAHTEMRSEPSLALVLASPDRGLGPALRPAQRDCATQTPSPPIRTLPPGRNTPRPFPTPEEAMMACGYAEIGGTLYSGGITMPMLASVLGRGRRVVDQTGVSGAYALTMTNFAPSSSPDWISRVENDLGVRLVPSTTDVEVIVIDHIDHPTKN